MSEKYYTLGELSRDFLSNTKLTPRQINIGLNNINNICKFLGKDWVKKHFHGISGTAIFFELSKIGEDLKYLQHVKRGRVLIQKIKVAKTNQEFNPYRTELSIISKFAKYAIPVYYEPILVVNRKRKVPDFKIKVNNKWVYLEICQPKNIMWAPITKISNQLLRAITTDKQYSLFLLLAKEPNQQEMEILESTSTEMIQQFKSGSCSKIINNFAQIIVDDSDPRIVSRFIKLKKGYHSVNVCVLKNYNGKIQKINLQFPFTDDRAENILKKEAYHFSRKTRNLIIFSMGSLGKSMGKWKAIISKRLKGGINKRINGVFLLDSVMSGTSGKSIKKKIVYIPHQNPYKPLRGDEVDFIKRALLN